MEHNPFTIVYTGFTCNNDLIHLLMTIPKTHRVANKLSGGVESPTGTLLIQIEHTEISNLTTM